MNKEEIIFEAEEPTEAYKFGLIEHLARETAKNMDDYVFNLIRENKQLQQKVNQLETNRDEAIENLTYMSTDAYVEDYDIREKCNDLLISILIRGKE